MGNPRRKLLVYVGIILWFNAVCCLGSKFARSSSARLIAERAGAAQFKESIEETDHFVRRNHHDIVKRLATEEIDDDSDYEVYQGVVGRAGIDFPVLTGIPVTNFNCRKIGNGYFADLETECQVFHICDSGRKISFLCPNGTIFKQTELICDWWFKVDCSKSPGHYADSAEILSRGQEKRRHPTRASNIEYNLRTPSRRVKEERRTDRPTNRNPSYNSRSQFKSSEENSGSEYSNESYDFEDDPVPVVRPVTNNIRKSPRKFQQINEQSSRGTARPRHSNREGQRLRESDSFLINTEDDELTSANLNPTTHRSQHKSSKGTLRPHEESNTETQEYAESASFINTGSDNFSSTDRNNLKQNKSEYKTTRGTIKPNVEYNTETFGNSNAYDYASTNKNPSLNNFGSSTHNSKLNDEHKTTRGTLKPHGESNTETQEFAESGSFYNSGSDDSPINKITSTDKKDISSQKSRPIIEHKITKGTLRPQNESNTEQQQYTERATNKNSENIPITSNIVTSTYKSHSTIQDIETTDNLSSFVKTTGETQPDFSTETQELAESASFVQGNGYRHQLNIDDNYEKSNSYSQKHNIDEKQVKSTTIAPTTYSRRGSGKFININDGKSTTTNLRSRERLSLTTSTPSFDNEHSYTTAKRLGTTKDAPFYTPTVPTLINRVVTIDIDSSINHSPTITTKTTTTTQSSPSEHAIEMMKMLKDLEVIPTAETQKYFNSSRPGLIIPPSSGPDTLHSLALYFATAVDTYAVKKNTTVDLDDLPQELKDETEAAIATALLSSKTVQKYDQLFGKGETTTENNLVASRGSQEENNDLVTEYSKHPVLSASGTPQVRELAQVFTHALSAYLHDPETFRRILSDIRPTEPPSLETNEILFNRISRTESDKTGSTPLSTNGATYLPTSTTPIPTQTMTTTTTEDFEVLDFSDVTLSTVRRDSTDPIFETTSTTEMPKDYTTTDTSIDSTTIDYPSNTLNNIIKTPASDLIAGKLDLSSNTVNDEKILSRLSVSNGNPLAAEINVGLLLSTMYPYISDSVEKDSTEGSNYFPINNKDDTIVNKTLKPYGHDVKPVNSTPIVNPISSEKLTELWGGKTLSEIASTTTDFPFLSSDLLPPSVINSNINKNILLPDENLLPPSNDDTTTESDEHLQKAQSQSFVASRNNYERQSKKLSDNSNVNKLSYGDDVTTTQSTILKSSIKGHYITEIAPTEQSTINIQSTTDLPKTTLPDSGTFSPNPWSSLAYTVFLDPLTINDGLMDSGESSSYRPSSPTTLFDKVSIYSETTTPASSTPSEYSETTYHFEPTIPTTQTPTKVSEILRRGKSIATSSRFGENQNENINHNKKESMQEIANEIFGELNETSVNSLMNVMKKADNNKTVKHLILLLIQTCDDDFNKTVEESRQALLNALIGMDDNQHSEIQIINARSNRISKNIAKPSSTTTTTTTSTTEIPITTYRSNSHEQYTSTSLEITTTSVPSSGESTTTNSYDYSGETTKTESRFRIDLSEEYETTTNIASTQYTSDSDYTTFSTQFTDDTTTIIPVTTTTTELPRYDPTLTQTSSKRKGKSLDGYLAQSNQSTSSENGGSASSKHSDARALELLKSLYSLAAKWSKR